MVCVDEIGKARKDEKKNGFTNVDALSVLTRHLDKDDSLYIAVSSLNAHDLVKLSMGSERSLLLQPLGPLWFTDSFNEKSCHLLPELLQPFCVEGKRQLLPFTPADKALYGELAGLLVTAAGHPRRHEVLYRLLREFPAPPAVTCIPSGRKFVDALSNWLHADMKELLKTRLEYIEDSVNDIVPFSSDFKHLVPMTPGEVDRLPGAQRDATVADAVEELATYTARRFIMPRTKASAEQLRSVLTGMAEGMCQLVSTGGGRRNLLVFIPLPVLVGSARLSVKRPCTEALYLLRDAINRLHAHKDGRGGGDAAGQGCEEEEDAAALSVLLFARCNHMFTLSQLCGPGASGQKLGVVLAGGPEVQLITVDRQQPIDQSSMVITPEEMRGLVDGLKKCGTPGAIIRVRGTQHNGVSGGGGGDGCFYGLFRVADGGNAFVACRVQARDWLAEERAGVGVGSRLQEWRRQQRDGLWPDTVELPDGASVSLVSLLFTSASPVQQQFEVKLEADEGLVSLDSMRTWLPTAAHALHTVTHLRRIFGWSNNTEKEEEGRQAGAAEGV